jgi:hypothetical protein
MKSILIAALLVSLTACGSSQNENEQDSVPPADTTVTVQPVPVSSDSVRDYLSQSCVADLYAQNPTSQFEFRNASLGYKTANGQPYFVLCGEFRSKAQDQWTEWIPFATIKTAAYEQWQGAPAISYCADTALMRNMMDISPMIQTKMDSLQKQ